MIFTKKIIKYGTIKWKKKFAFFPIKIKVDKNKGIETIIWLEFYEQKYIYYGGFSKWISECEYRLIDKSSMK